ncbi:MAG: helix-turn-helix domain-containing protein [Candidatus Korarchaeota archaeon]|nr:helix-turn-helix domain-containing protein [Candidatus Korarchaeota archaeon]NIU82946.1 helix-turn-helix domain-containing protein [Candidatus Thorarchaeota archaeon]NIW13369.1 helix-turn-helix domain-containing protein [Candidatus Thorarchaeota archaeon]NIW51469.1 helix-turn-helix domain-containing protein [Candidatus Korarchaeota archaeon]
MPAPISITRDVSREELVERMKQEEDSKIKNRIMMLVRLKDLRSGTKVAEDLGYATDTVCLWVKRFNEGGFDNLHDKPRSGRSRKLTKQEVEGVLSKSPSDFGYNIEGWTTTILHKHLVQEEEIECNPRTVRRRVKELGYSAITPVTLDERADPGERETFKKNVEAPCNE